MSRHPEVLWAQRSSETDEEKNVLFVTVNLPNIVKSTFDFKLEPTKIALKARAGVDAEQKDYEFSIDLYKEIDVEKSTQRLTSRALILTLRKATAELEYWPRLTKEKLRTQFIKTDFSKWVDEDEQDAAPTAAADEDEGPDMGGMGGMPGMGGMGGMPGMGGMGGMPGMEGLGGGGFGGMPGMEGLGGNMDIQKMLAQMGGAGGLGGGGGPSGSGGFDGADLDNDDDDDDDDGPPPLEDAEPAKP
ncbi:HSP20-like chaperone [Auriscalpium vulgare]|uniref:HSP20-like chaperone n=1 Tax=Auriscalpium vulgare TaxID=40419 RepID=A0ACB8RNW6_9AGAM|nr:HSP20-like chaperone [Auriscalpium vulgare]